MAFPTTAGCTLRVRSRQPRPWSTHATSGQPTPAISPERPSVVLSGREPLYPCSCGLTRWPSCPRRFVSGLLASSPRSNGRKHAAELLPASSGRTRRTGPHVLAGARSTTTIGDDMLWLSPFSLSGSCVQRGRRAPRGSRRRLGWVLLSGDGTGRWFVILASRGPNARGLRSILGFARIFVASWSELDQEIPQTIPSPSGFRFGFAVE